MEVMGVNPFQALVIPRLAALVVMLPLIFSVARKLEGHARFKGSAYVYVGVPVIASGGVGTLDHLVDGVVLGGATGVLAASIFHFGEHTIAEAKAAMAAAGVDVRPHWGHR